MNKITGLINEARESTTFRQHSMSKFWHYSFNKRAYSECNKCGARVNVNTKPLPNEIEIGGTAVAINCKT